jgi:hypothetical protein
MKLRRLGLQSLVVLLMSVGGLFLVSAPASAVGAPQNIQVHFQASLAKIDWGVVSGAQKYRVEIQKIGYYCPCVSYTTTSTQLNIGYASFPYTSQQGAYQVQVTSIGPDGGTASSTKKFQTKSSGEGVATSQASRAADKVNTCLHNGQAAGLATLAGGGIVVAATSWIPGVDVVTAAAVIEATAAATVGVFAVCLVPWP